MGISRASALPQSAQTLRVPHAPQMDELKEPSSLAQLFEAAELPQHPRARELPRPPQMTQIPPLNSMLDGVANAQQDSRILQHQIQHINRPSQSMSTLNDGNTHQQPITVGGSRKEHYEQIELPVNPYALRADQIGLRHSWATVGTLEDLLTHPGWQEGQEPINEDEATRLFNRSRAISEQEASDFAKSVDHEANRELLTAEFNKRHDARRKIDESILTERRKIRQAFDKYKCYLAEIASGHLKPHQGEVLQNQFSQHPFGEASHSMSNVEPFQTPTQTSFPGHQGCQWNRPAGIPCNMNGFPGPPLSASLSHQRMRLHLPQVSPLTPSFLDPTLIPQSYDAVLHHYHRNKAIVMQYNAENEQYLANWLAKYGHAPPEGSQNSLSISPTVSMGAGPFACVHDAPVPLSHTQADQTSVSQITDPPVQRKYSPEQQLGHHTPAKMMTAVQHTMDRQQSENRMNRRLREGQYMEGQDMDNQTIAESGRRRGLSRPREVETIHSQPRGIPDRQAMVSVPEGYEPTIRKISATRNASLKSAAKYAHRQPKFFKPNAKIAPAEPKSQNDTSSLEDLIASANLPTPKISDTALLASGIQPKSKQVSQVSGPGPGKRRRGKSPFDPSRPLRYSGSMADAIRATGMPQVRQKRPNIAPIPPSLQGFTPSPNTHANSTNATTTSQTPGPSHAPIDLSHEHKTVKEDLTTQGPQIAQKMPGASHSTINDFRSSNDGDDGKHNNSVRDNATTQKFATLRETSSVPAKRRSSVGTRLMTQRSRQGTHGPNDAENENPRSVSERPEARADMIE